MKKFALIFFLSLNFSLASRAQVDNVGSGRAIWFDGQDDLINFGNIYDDLTYPLTFSAWVKMDVGNYVGPLFTSQDNGPVYNGFWVVITQNNVNMEFGDGRGENHPSYRKGIVANINGLADRWIHVCGVMKSRDAMEIYINGLRMPSGDSGGESTEEMDSNFPTDEAKAGFWTSNGIPRFYKGWMDEVRVWNIALTEAQIRNTMCVRLKGNEPGLIGYWNFDEVSGTTINDSSSKNYDGTLQGGAIRGYSGAPIGNESSFIYGNGISEFSWDGLQVKDITNDPPGIQVYKVNDAPSQVGGLNPDMVQKPYYGVFVSNLGSNNGFDIDAKCAFLRTDNTVSEWQKLPPNDFINRTEILVQPTETLDVSLGDDIMICPQEVILEPMIDLTGKTIVWSTGATTPSVSVDQPGLYSVTVSEGCKMGFDEIQVDFLPAPIISLDLGEDRVLCSETSYSIGTGLDQDDGDFLWSNGSTDPSLIVTQSGEYKLHVTQGCTTVKDSINILFVPLGKLDFDLGDDVTLCSGKVFELSVSGLEGSLFQWSTGEQGSSIDVREPGIYKVFATYGCAEGADSVNVDYLTRSGSAKRFVPNVITPNGDSKNQFFIIQKLLDQPIGLDIFNRWGGKVYGSGDYKNNWDGGDLTAGVYFYHLRDECGNIFKGTITLSY